MIHGTAGDDRILGLGGNDTIFRLGDNDQVAGGKGNDTVCGHDGDDLLTGEGSTDRLSVTPGGTTSRWHGDDLFERPDAGRLSGGDSFDRAGREGRSATPPPRATDCHGLTRGWPRV